MTNAPAGADLTMDDNALVSLAQALVRLATVADDGAVAVESPAAALLAEVMTGFGWQVQIEEVAPGRPNVVGIVEGGRGPGRTLMFEGHTDVVTAGDRSSWSFDPFGGDLVDGRLRGRGAADMKSGLAAMIHAARAVQLGGFRGRILVAALVDEEGMMLGAKHFARSTLRSVAPEGIDGVIVCEPEGGEICAVAKGAIRLVVEFTGLMAHGAMPEHGRSPLPAAAALVIGLGELERQLGAEVGEHEHLGRLYLTPTVLTAGDPAQINVIPAVAAVWVDVRTVPGLSHPSLLTLIGELAERIGDEAGLLTRLEVIDDRPPVDTPVDAPVVQALAAAHLAVTGAAAVFGGVPGTTDGTILTRDADLVTVVYGPGGKWIAHQADEYVEVADIVTCARVYAEAARLFLGSAG